MNDALVYLSAIMFSIAIFPLHVINYVYLSTAEKYASVNVTVYRLLTILNINTDKTGKSQKKKKKNKEDKKDNKLMTPANWLAIFNKLCLTKIVQLGDYGLMEPDNAYLALANNALTNAVYTFVKINGGKTKLKNYSVLNYEHANVNYYLKLVGIINIITLTRLITVFYWGKLHEH